MRVSFFGGRGHRAQRASVTGAGSLVNPSPFLTAGQATRSGVEVTAESALTLPAVLCAVSLLADCSAMLPLHVYEGVRGERGRRKDKGHALYRLLHAQPNPYQTSFEFRRGGVGNLKTRGNWFSEIEWGNDGWPRALWPMPADRVRMLRLPSTGEIWYQYTPAESGVVYLLPRVNVLHISDFSINGLLGTSPLLRAKESVGMALALEEYAARFFGQGAQPGGVVSFPEGVDDDADKEAYRKLFEKRSAGLENAHRIIVVADKAEWTPTGVSPKESQGLESRQFGTTQVAQLLRIPPSLLMDLSSAHYNVPEHLFLQFRTTSLQPLCEMIEQRLEMQLLLEGGQKTHYVEHLLDAMERADLETRINALVKEIQYGIRTIDEARELQNLGAHPGGFGGLALVPVNVQPLEVWTKEKIAAGPGKVKPGATAGGGGPTGDGADGADFGDGDGEGKKGAKKARAAGGVAPGRRESTPAEVAAGEIASSGTPRNDGGGEDDGGEELDLGAVEEEVLDRLTARVALEGVLRTELEVIAEEEVAAVLALVAERQGDLEPWIEGYYFDTLPGLMRERLAEPVQEQVQKIFEASGLEARALIEGAGKEFPVAAEVDVAGIAAGVVSGVIASWVAESRGLVAGVLEESGERDYTDGHGQARTEEHSLAGTPDRGTQTRDAAAEKEALAELLEEMEEALSEGEERARKTAAEKAVRAEGKLVVLVAKLLNLKLVWRTGGKPCHMCSPLNGKTLQGGDKFVESGQTLPGKGGDGKGGLKVHRSVRHPPLHKGCKCYVGFVI